MKYNHQGACGPNQKIKHDINLGFQTKNRAVQTDSKKRHHGKNTRRGNRWRGFKGFKHKDKIKRNINKTIQEYITKIDTIIQKLNDKTELVKEKNQLETFISHKVKKKETLYSISNKFNLQIDDIIKYNPELNTEKLKKKAIIIIPLKKTLRKIENAKIVDKIISNDSVSKPIKLKVKKDLLKVAYLAPFKIPSIEIDSVENLNSYLKEINLTTISINFYNGIIHAIDELKKNNVSVDLDVFDTDNNISQVEIIRENNDFDNYDLIIGPLINRNFNAFFKKEFKSNSISPLVYDGINLNSNTIVPEADDLLKREKMFSIIDDLILNNQDQCALIISDSLNQK